MILVFIKDPQMAYGASNLPSAVIQRNQSRSNFSSYQYPSILNGHNIVLMFKTYDYNASGSGTVQQSAVSDTAASVVLPLPSNLEDTYSVKVGPYEMGASGALAADAFTGQGRDAIMSSLRGATEGGAQDAAQGGVANLLNNMQSAAAFAGRNVLDELPVGGVAGAVDLVSGTAVNPHVALKFDGVDLKTHNFEWGLSPRNEAEAANIKKLINYIRSRMLPEYGNATGENGSAIDRALLKYPDLVYIFFMGVDQSYFYYFKPCMINSFTANYTPNGVALNRGGRPAFVNIRMTLTEARIHTREDVNLG